MAVTEAQARRAVRGLEFEWDEAVRDPRSPRSQRHGHRGILSGLAGAFACGLVHLREAIKGNQPKLHQLVVPLFESAAQSPRLCADELRNGARIFPELYTVKVDDLPEEVQFPGAKEVWCVRQLSQPVEGSSAEPTRR